MILITGANGMLGRLVVSEVKKNFPVSEIAVSVRDSEKAKDLAEAGIDVRVADFNDIESAVKAFSGIDKVLIISTRGGVDVVSEHKNAIKAAVLAGVKHLVYTSGTKESTSYIGVVHSETEKEITDSGIPYTILRNNLYAEVLANDISDAVKSGALNAPVGEGRVAAITRADCAKAAAVVLTTDGHQNKIYEITGSEQIGWNNLAEIASEISGKEIVYTPDSEEAYKSKLIAMGMPEIQIDFILKRYKSYFDHEYEKVSDDFKNLTGTSPTATWEYIKETAKKLLSE